LKQFTIVIQTTMTNRFTSFLGCNRLSQLKKPPAGGFKVKHGPQRGQNPRKYSKTDGFASCGMIEPDIIRRDMVTSADACGAKTIQDRAPHFAG
jgi:hypothetical protein